MPEKQTPTALSQAPIVGLLPVMDPRIDPELEKKILGYLELETKLGSLGVRVVWPGRAISREEEAVAAVERMRAEGACGIVYFTCWFLRANVIVGACQHSHLPALVWSIPNLDDTSLIGFGVTHGSLDEVGFQHEVICDEWNAASQRKMLAWIKACQVKAKAARSRYGHVGGKCLSMMTADSDANQWRRQFGIDVDHAEQWTLIHEAETRARRGYGSAHPAVESRVQGRRRVRRRAPQVGPLVSGRQGDVRPQPLGFRRREVPVRASGQLPVTVSPDCLVERRRFRRGLRDRHERRVDDVRVHQFSGHPVMFSDIQYLNRAEGWARFLNCGTAATKLAGGKENVVLKNCPEIQGTYDEATGKHLCKGGACPHFILPPGRVTLARFGRIAGRYVLHACGGESFAYPHDPNSLLGIGGVWPFAYVKIEQDMDRFVSNLRAHHMCIVPGDWLPELESLARLWGVEIL